MKKILLTVSAGILLNFSPFMTMVAQAERIHLGSYKDWDAFVQKLKDGSRICYMASMPKSKSPASISHGKPIITITHRPELKIKNEFNFIVGYKFKYNSAVRLTIDKNKSFNLFTNGTGAWASNSGLDALLSQSMKRGTNILVNATHHRIKATSYRFSLSGFTAAHNAITKSCR